MRAALAKTTIETKLASRFGPEVFRLTTPAYTEIISTGIPEIDALAGGLPRGAITEIYGSESSGRTSFLLSVLAYATTHDEVCALVDTNDVLDPQSSTITGMNLDQLLWIRCAGHLEHSFKAVDLLLQGGGFGLVVLDLGDVRAKDSRRIIWSWWHRFKRVVENSPTALLVIAQDSCVRSCAALTLALTSKETSWSKIRNLQENDWQSRLTSASRLETTTNLRKQNLGFMSHGNLLRCSSIEIQRVKPMNLAPCQVRFGT
jgi:hypothetical protein